MLYGRCCPLKRTFRAVAKELFGARYEILQKSLLASGILFLAVKAAAWRLPVAPAILYLTSTLFSAGVMGQALCGTRRAEALEGMLALPFGNRQLVCSYLLGFSVHTLLTKMLPVWALLFALGRIGGLELAAALCCGGNGCLSAGAAYLLAKEKRQILPAAGLGAAGIVLVLLTAPDSFLVLAVSGLGIAGAVRCLLSANAYDLMPGARKQKSARHAGRRGSMGPYLLRYLTARRAYLINTAGLGVVACLLPRLLGEFPDLATLPLGFAILALNTPLCTLLSGDPALEQAVRGLPSQIRRFCLPYGLLLAGVNGGVYAVYLASWQFYNRGIQGRDLRAAGLFAIQSAVLSVWLEWRHPLHGWKTESDLWHHPRKYLVPLGMLLLAFWAGSWPPALGIWTIVLAAEVVLAALQNSTFA